MTSKKTEASPTHAEVVNFRKYGGIAILAVAAHGLAAAQNQSQPQDRPQSRVTARGDRPAPDQANGSDERVPARPSQLAKPNNTLINIRGTIGRVGADAFTLDYGGGTITVEMDDLAPDADAYGLLKGDVVTIMGAIDDDLFETSTIEASSVYVEKLDTYFYASALDEEDLAAFPVDVPISIVAPAAAVRGVVTAVDNEGFTLSAGARGISVTVENLADDPLDDAGDPQIEVGDLVIVSGEVDHNFFGGRQLDATAVTTLAKDSG